MKRRRKSIRLPTHLPTSRRLRLESRGGKRDRSSIEKIDKARWSPAVPRTARVAPGGIVFHVLKRGVGTTQTGREVLPTSHAEPRSRGVTRLSPAQPLAAIGQEEYHEPKAESRERKTEG